MKMRSPIPLIFLRAFCSLHTFDPTQDDVINYGAEGAVVGHELTHDFDDQGRKFDVKGNLRDWWTQEDAKQYDQRGDCISKEYTGPVQGISGVEQNGNLTQGEDTADNGGLYLALSALSEDLKQQGKTIEDKDSHGLTNLQRFFIAYGTAWCDQIRPEAVKTLIQTNPHSVPWERVNNVVVATCLSSKRHSAAKRVNRWFTQRAAACGDGECGSAAFWHENSAIPVIYSVAGSFASERVGLSG